MPLDSTPDEPQEDKSIQRYWAGDLDKYGNRCVFDRENTEPVCLCYEKFHVNAAQAIANLLNGIRSEDNPVTVDEIIEWDDDRDASAESQDEFIEAMCKRFAGRPIAKGEE